MGINKAAHISFTHILIQCIVFVWWLCSIASRCWRNRRLSVLSWLVSFHSVAKRAEEGIPFENVDKLFSLHFVVVIVVEKYTIYLINCANVTKTHYTIVWNTEFSWAQIVLHNCNNQTPMGIASVDLIRNCCTKMCASSFQCDESCIRLNWLFNYNFNIFEVKRNEQ